MSIYKFKLPDVGEGMAEGTIGKWHVKEGDTIKKDADLVQIENDKSVEEIPSPVEGKVTKIVVPEGETADVGDTLVEIQTAGDTEEPKEIDADSTKDDSTAKTEKKTSKAKTQAESTVSKQTAAKNIPSKSFTPQDHSLPVLAMPSVRAYARDKGVKLTEVTGTGNHGQITKQDIDSFLSGNTASQKIVPAQDLNEQKPSASAKATVNNNGVHEHHEKMDSVRLATAKSVARSVQEIPHVTMFDEVVVDKLWDHRKKFKEKAAAQDIHLTFLPYIIKALAVAVKEYPVLNASLDMDKREIIYKDDINVGIATDTDRGLFMPNIKHVDQKSMFEIAKEIQKNTKAIEDGTLSNDSMQNGTIAITNIGSIGGGYFTPIINYPEVAILGIGRIENQPVVDPADSENVTVGKAMKLSLSVDHRAIDGATGQKALNRIKELLADPELLLMEG